MANRRLNTPYPRLNGARGRAARHRTGGVSRLLLGPHAASPIYGSCLLDAWQPLNFMVEYCLQFTECSHPGGLFDRTSLQPTLVKWYKKVCEPLAT
jgi:hypothetical protein